MSKEIKWAVLGTGVIANEMAAGLQKMGKSLYAVGNRPYDKAVAFSEKYGIEKVYPSIDEMFDDEDVDIIYIIAAFVDVPFCNVVVCIKAFAKIAGVDCLNAKAVVLVVIVALKQS